MKRLRVGIIGTGMAFERLHLPAYQRLHDEYEIVALCDREHHKALAWGKQLGVPEESIYDDYRSLARRDDVDVIDIMVPIELNYPVTHEVARIIAHSHQGIICEKPLGSDLNEIEAARDLPRKYGVPIMIAENYRYDEETDLVRDLVRQQRIGAVVYFIQNRVVNMPQDMLGNEFAAKEWRQHPEFPGGVITDTAVHDLGALRHIFGSIKQVQAFGVPIDADFAPFNVVNANLLFHNGVTGQFSFFCSGKEMQRPLIGLRIFGTAGMIYLEEKDAGIINIAYNDGSAEQLSYRPEQGFYRELINFHKAMNHAEPIFVTPELEFGDTKTILAIVKSAATGGKVLEVDEEPEYVVSH